MNTTYMSMADVELLNQYKSELEDLEKGVGLARLMSKGEIRSAKLQLKEHIKSLESALNNSIILH